jgi:hypothetical protein
LRPHCYGSAGECEIYMDAIMNIFAPTNARKESR